MKTGGKRNSDTGTSPIDTGTTVTWNTYTGTPTQSPSKGTANVFKGARFNGRNASRQSSSAISKKGALGT